MLMQLWCQGAKCWKLECVIRPSNLKLKNKDLQIQSLKDSDMIRKQKGLLIKDLKLGK